MHIQIEENNCKMLPYRIIITEKTFIQVHNYASLSDAQSRVAKILSYANEVLKNEQK